MKRKLNDVIYKCYFYAQCQRILISNYIRKLASTMKVLFLLMKDIVYVYKTSIKKGLGDQNKLYNRHFSGDSKYMSHEIVDGV